MPDPQPTLIRPSRRQRVLLGANLALLAGVVVVHWAASPGRAQDGLDRGRGSYLMIGGEIQGGDSNAVYILDTINEEMIAVRWNHSRSQLDGLGYRDVRRDAAQEGGR